MGQYFYNLADGHGGFYDEVGIDLPDDRVAVAHARLVAAELLKNRKKKSGHWRIEVQNAERKRIFETALIKQHEDFERLSPDVQRSFERLSDRCCALHDTVAEARATIRRSRELAARFRNRPHLVVDNG